MSTETPAAPAPVAQARPDDPLTIDAAFPVQQRAAAPAVAQGAPAAAAPAPPAAAPTQPAPQAQAAPPSAPATQPPPAQGQPTAQGQPQGQPPAQGAPNGQAQQPPANPFLATLAAIKENAGPIIKTGLTLAAGVAIGKRRAGRGGGNRGA